MFLTNQIGDLQQVKSLVIMDSSMWWRHKEITCYVPQVESYSGLSWSGQVFGAVVHPQSGHNLQFQVCQHLWSMQVNPSRLIETRRSAIHHLLAKLLPGQLVDQWSLPHPRVPNHNHLQSIHSEDNDQDDNLHSNHYPQSTVPKKYLELSVYCISHALHLNIVNHKSLCLHHHYQ